ncbi:MAG: hypothetical protein HC930_08225 [Hydrococcus sp. SU_1_0]|nr:hypothetical protein [Hydrococcus sp. SU_1_0]
MNKEIVTEKVSYIDLQELSTQLLESKPPLKDAVLKTKAAVTIKAKDLVSLYPELKSINSLPLINYRKNNSGSIAVLTLNIYKFQNNPVITIPDSNCNITEDFDIKSYFLDVEYI